MPSLALAWKLYFSGWWMAGWLAGLTVIIMLLSPAGAWALAELGKIKLSKVHWNNNIYKTTKFDIHNFGSKKCG